MAAQPLQQLDQFLVSGEVGVCAVVHAEEEVRARRPSARRHAAAQPDANRALRFVLVVTGTGLDHHLALRLALAGTAVFVFTLVLRLVVAGIGVDDGTHRLGEREPLGELMGLTEGLPLLVLRVVESRSLASAA